VRGDQRQVDVARLADRLAVVQRFQHGQLARAFLKDAGDPEQVLGALGAGQRRPRYERAPRRRHGPIHVLRAGHRHLGQDLLGGRVDRLEDVLAGGELTVDEQAVRRRDLDDRTGFGSGRIFEHDHSGFFLQCGEAALIQSSVK
jgi:hypothetical protein